MCVVPCNMLVSSAHKPMRHTKIHGARHVMHMLEEQGNLNMNLSFLTERNFWLAVTVCAIALMFIL